MSIDKKIPALLQSANHFLVFFLLVAFVITCCMSLFLTVLSRTLNIQFTSENIHVAAKLTMVNVVFLSLLFAGIDAIRRKLTVDRPAKCITDAAKQIMAGDFSVRIPMSHALSLNGKFDEIADCINQMAQEIGSVETLRTDFIANVSHELKTPLAVMQNYGALLQQPNLSEEARLEYAKSITDASRRLASLITNILKLNKLENQQITPQAEAYHLREQVCACLLGFEEAWEEKGLNIETDLEDDLFVRSDPEMMSLVWNNLFSNAIKFTEPGGTVSLTIRSEGDYALVTVSDTGCGISRDVGAHIFDKFYQGDTSHATQGNGLGLALVKRVIDLTGNDISVESELGKGTSFTVKMRRIKHE